jgi:hypothetical protein
LVGVTQDGRLYQQDYDIISTRRYWFPIPTVSSTEAQTIKCSGPGCKTLVEYVPENYRGWEPVELVCRLHMELDGPDEVVE